MAISSTDSFREFVQRLFKNGYSKGLAAQTLTTRNKALLFEFKPIVIVANGIELRPLHSTVADFADLLFCRFVFLQICFLPCDSYQLTNRMYHLICKLFAS